MDKSKSRYSYESRCKGFTRHGSLQSAPPSGESSGRPVDPRRAQPRVSSSLHPSFRIPRKDSSSSIRSPEAASRSKSSHWASRWDDRSRRERREVKDKHSSRSGLACLSDDRESSVKKGYREGCETGSDEELQGRGAKSIRPSSLSCGSERWIRKKAHMDRHASFTEAKRRRTGGSSEEEGGAPKSVRARLAQDRDKVFQLGTKQPTEVTTVLGPICGSPPYSNAQRGSSAVSSAVHHIEGAVDSVSCSVQAASSPEPLPPGVSPEAPAKRKRGRPCKSTTSSSPLMDKSEKVAVGAVSWQQEKQKKEAQPILVLSDCSSADEWPIVPSPVPAQSLPTPMSCSDTEEEESSSIIVPERACIDPLPGAEGDSNNAVNPPKDAVVSQVPLEERVEESLCHHKDSAGKRCCNPAVEGKRLCKCHYKNTLELQEALGLLISSSAGELQESSEGGQKTPQMTEANPCTLKTEPVSPEMECAPPVAKPISPVTELPPTVMKAEPPSALEKMQSLSDHPDCPEAMQTSEVQIKKEPQEIPTDVTLQSDSEGADQSESVGQMNASFSELDPSAIVVSGELRVVPEPSKEEASAALSPLNELNVKEQGLVARLVTLRKKRLAKEKEIAVLLQHVEEIKQEIQQASTEWTQVNEAKRLLVLGEAATVQETCSAKQQLQQDGSETQDAHTTGSPVPAGLTTPPAQLLQQPACSSVAAPVSHTTAQAMGRLFQPTHTDSVLDVKLATNVMITTSRDHTTHMYDTSSGHILGIYKNNSKAVTCLDVSAGMFATGSNDCQVLVYAVERCTQPLRMTASSKVMCLKIVGNMIVAGLDNGRVQVFKVTHLAPVWTVRCYEQNRPITAIDANKQYLVVGTAEESNPIMYWRLQDFLPAKGSPLYSNNQCLSGMGGNILSFQLPSENTLFSSTSQGRVLIHNLTSGSLVHWVQAASSPIPCVHVTDSGHLFVSTMNSTIKCFSMKDYSMQGALHMPHPVYRFTVMQNYVYYGDNQGSVGAICTDTILL